MKNDFSASPGVNGSDSGGIFCTPGGQGRLACEPWNADAPATATAVATVATTTSEPTRRVTCYFLIIVASGFSRKDA